MWQLWAWGLPQGQIPAPGTDIPIGGGVALGSESPGTMPGDLHELPPWRSRSQTTELYGGPSGIECYFHRLPWVRKYAFILEIFPFLNGSTF